MNLNMQPHEGIKPSCGEGKLDIVSIFPTIQGEGPFAGERAVFIRLAGCNFECPGCDTDYTTGRKKMTFPDIWSEVQEAFATFNAVSPSEILIVLTGGEPLRQDIGPFITYLFNQRVKLNTGLHVQIETNGSIYRDDLPWFAIGLSVVCSPKAGIVDDDLKQHIMAYKYVLQTGQVDPEDGLPSTHLGGICKVARPHPGFKNTVYVQPLDPLLDDADSYAANLAACVDSCKKFGYRLGLQFHKILNLP